MTPVTGRCHTTVVKPGKEGNMVERGEMGASIINMSQVIETPPRRCESLGGADVLRIQGVCMFATKEAHNTGESLDGSMARWLAG